MVRSAEKHGLWDPGRTYRFTTTNSATGEMIFFELELIRIDQDGALFMPVKNRDRQKTNIILALMSNAVHIEKINFYPNDNGFSK